MNSTAINHGLVNPYGEAMGQIQFIVHSFMVIGTGTYHPLQLRPYTGNLTASGLNMFMEATNGGQQVNAGTLAGISGYLMAPSTAPTGQIQMPNGFGQERVRWFMVVQVVRPGNFSMMPVYQIIAGYSDTPEIDFNSQLVSPSLALRINSVTTVRQLSDGNVIVEDTSHLIYQMPNFAAAMGMPTRDFNTPRMQTMMPEDVMAMIGSLNLNGGFGGDGIDGRGQSMMSPVVKSRRTNSLTTNYLDMSLNSYANAVLAPEYINADAFEIASYARGRVAENSVSADQFIMTIRTRTNYDACGFLTYGELCSLLPDADNKCQIFDNRSNVNNSGSGMPGPIMFGANTAGNYIDWANQMPETLFATRIIQTIPAIMTSLSLTYIQIIATNRVIDGTECKIDYFQPNSPIPALNLNPFLRRFTDRLVVEVFRDLSLHGQIDYFVSIVVDVFGDTFVRISLNGGPEIDYNMPSFSDALAVPVLAADSNPLMSVAHTVQQITSNIVPNVHQNHTVNHDAVMQNSAY